MGAVDQALASEIIHYEYERTRGGTEVPLATHARLLGEHYRFLIAAGDESPSRVDEAGERVWKLSQTTATTIDVSVHLTRLRAFLHDTGFGPETSTS